jgi:hypothetical protein
LLFLIQSQCCGTTSTSTPLAASALR